MVAWEETVGNMKVQSSSGNNKFNALSPQHGKPEAEAIHSTADNTVLEKLSRTEASSSDGERREVKFITSKVMARGRLSRAKVHIGTGMLSLRRNVVVCFS